MKSVPVILVAVLSIVLSGVYTFSEASAQSGVMKTIVIDPGHGGYDKGVRGTDGIDEKDVNLALARLVAERLERHHRLVLTRTGDYFLENAVRVARANRAKADLFLSLHAAGGWSREQQCLTVSYYKKEAPGYGDKAPGMTEMTGGDRTSVFLDWQTVQHNHYTGSRVAATILRDALSGVFNNGRGRIVEARLAVLIGADMPAVMIESGCLSRLAGRSADPDALSLPRLADAIGEAVERVLNEL